LPHLLAPFEDRNVGAVGTCKRVRRIHQGFSSADFWNFIGALYLERHNFECAATNAIDGGVFVISGRTSAHRTQILAAPDFMHEYLHEYCFFGLVGPLHADDDNFITRWMVNHGWKTVFQHTPGACMETTLGEYPKFLTQCLRWVRTTWRSNFTSLFIERTVWRNQPWCVYAVYLTSFFNFALFYDLAMFSTLWLALNASPEKGIETSTAMTYFGLWVTFSKLVKTTPHFWRNPKDLIYLPGQIMFGYFHSLIKLYALFTFYVTAWGSRPGVDQPSGNVKNFFVMGLPIFQKGFESIARINGFSLFIYWLRAKLQATHTEVSPVNDVVV
jgi:cellulose synthase/poly-beta-1,6-N-acetylglucosamine synthase-like glycosyltransferase